MILFNRNTTEKTDHNTMIQHRSTHEYIPTKNTLQQENNTIGTHYDRNTPLQHTMRETILQYHSTTNTLYDRTTNKTITSWKYAITTRA
jgi:hypothetical protein